MLRPPAFHAPLRQRTLPESRITGITLRGVKITAERDLVIRDADEPRCEDVVRDIRPGIAPPREPYVE